MLRPPPALLLRPPPPLLLLLATLVLLACTPGSYADDTPPTDPQQRQQEQQPESLLLQQNLQRPPQQSPWYPRSKVSSPHTFHHHTSVSLVGSNVGDSERIGDGAVDTNFWHVAKEGVVLMPRDADVIDTFAGDTDDDDDVADAAPTIAIDIGGDENEQKNATAPDAGEQGAGDAAAATEPEAAPVDEEEPTELAVTQVDEDESSVRFNFASSEAGAKILRHSAEMKGAETLLMSNKDKYMMVPCEQAKWVTMQLSEDIIVDTIELGNFEHYSSGIQDFQVLGSDTYPTKQWVLLGNLRAKNVNTLQRFPLSHKTWVRYLKLRMTSHYGDEHYCTLSQVHVFGSTMLNSLRDDLRVTDDDVTQLQVAIDSEAQRMDHEDGDDDLGKQQSASDDDSSSVAGTDAAGAGAASDVVVDDEPDTESNETIVADDAESSDSRNATMGPASGDDRALPISDDGGHEDDTGADLRDSGGEESGDDVGASKDDNGAASNDTVTTTAHSHATNATANQDAVDATAGEASASSPSSVGTASVPADAPTDDGTASEPALNQPDSAVDNVKTNGTSSSESEASSSRGQPLNDADSPDQPSSEVVSSAAKDAGALTKAPSLDVVPVSEDDAALVAATTTTTSTTTTTTTVVSSNVNTTANTTANDTTTAAIVGTSSSETVSVAVMQADSANNSEVDLAGRMRARQQALHAELRKLARKISKASSFKAKPSADSHESVFKTLASKIKTIELTQSVSNKYTEELFATVSTALLAVSGDMHDLADHVQQDRQRIMELLRSVNRTHALHSQHVQTRIETLTADNALLRLTAAVAIGILLGVFIVRCQIERERKKKSKKKRKVTKAQSKARTATSA